ncbi:hypothetical protein GCM10023229_33790 [Flavisolibacter ginsenosidimutans]|uniref:Uncharacterized protein n=2 Tax=Flavisolibacter ginsenosidimutans TaxID=661481 RepID=A0A5B8UDQ6_9BACT|nr:hypothetical protein [Flavisolibacter ginsenosidimutans]QEC54475.1 hypothetical protein FSB75_00700 [Flavisolibacter ginsenosidimutans]
MMKKILETLVRAVTALRNWFAQQGRKQKQKRFAALFSRSVWQNRLAIEHSEITGGLLMALDRKNKKLLVIERSKNNKQRHCVPLTTLTSALVVRETNKSGGIQKIFLVLKQKHKDKNIRICFFNGAYNSAAELLLLSRCALRWKSRIDLYKHTDLMPV